MTTTIFITQWIVSVIVTNVAIFFSFKGECKPYRDYTVADYFESALTVLILSLIPFINWLVFLVCILFIVGNKLKDKVIIKRKDNGKDN